eukprot:TRINITY_DN4540_c0_g1_i1.p1 TRINITY_DN4540_c0_g1~~TRINITY_DN4540_c0_g1_i1.p1  ORF type:complete len:612 (-),score=116.75 TRINITY_DN4540_c0_g1_i1:29-1864(-)
MQMPLSRELFAACHPLAVIFVTLLTILAIIFGQALPSFEIAVQAVCPEKSDLLPLLRPRLVIPNGLIPNQQFNIHGVQCQITNIRCSQLQLDQAILESVNSAALMVNVSGVRTSCTADWSYKDLILSGSGQAALATSPRSGVAVWLEIATHPNVSLKLVGCNSRVQLSSLTFSGGVTAFILNEFKSTAQKYIEGELSSTLCTEVATALNSTSKLPDGNPNISPDPEHPAIYLEERDAFSIWEGVRKLFSLKEYLLGMAILLLSGLWPYVKQVLVLYVWFGPVRPGTAVRALHWVDLFGKWSMLDVLFVAVVAVVLKFDFQTAIAVGSIEVRPLIGVYVYCGAMLLALVSVAVLLHKARQHPRIARAIAADAEALVEVHTVDSYMRTQDKPDTEAPTFDLFAPESESDEADTLVPAPPRRLAPDLLGRIAQSLCRNAGVHIIGALSAFGGLWLTAYSLSKSINIDVLGTPVTDSSHRDYSLTATAKELFSANLSYLPLALVLVTFVVVVPVIKWIGILLIWFPIGTLYPKQVRARWLRRWFELLWPWDMRDVLLATLLVMVVRVKPMVHGMSNGYASIAMVIGSSPGFYLSVASVTIDYFVALWLPNSLSHV